MNPKSNKVLFLRTDACVFDPRVQKEAASLRRHGLSVSVFGWDRKAEYPKSEVIHDVCYIRTRIPGPYGSKLLAIVLPLFWVRAIIEIIKLKPDVIHACDLDALVPALFIKVITQTKVVYDIFDNFADKISGIPAVVRKTIRVIDHSLMIFADAVVVPDDNRRKLIGHIPVKSLHVIMNVPPTNNFEVISITQSNIVRICYAGVIHEHRGLHLIADAIKGIEGVETIFAGWIPRDIDRKFLDSQKSIRYLGKIAYEDSLQLLAESDIILALYDPSLPINMLASSNKIYEAMAFRKPVITNMETAMAEIVTQEQCGVLVPYGNSLALKETMLRLRDNSQLRKNLGMNGFDAFVKKYNWDIMERRLVDLYKKVLCGV